MRRTAARTIGVGLSTGLLLGVGLGTAEISGASATSPTPPCTSASYALTINVTAPASTWAISVNGQVDFVNHSATASLTLPSTIPFAPLAGTTLQAEVVGGTAYVAIPPAFSGFLGGASWVSIALPSALSTGLNTLLDQGAAWCANSQSIVLALGSHGGLTTSLGSSTVNNESATGTRIQQLGKRIPRALKLPHSLTKKSMPVFGSSRMPVEVWSNGQGQLVNLSIDGVSGSITLNLTNVNQPVTITPPSGAVSLSPAFLKLLGLL
jgi:hypothetical protein